MGPCLDVALVMGNGFLLLAVLLFSCYVLLVRLLRYRRSQRIQSSFGPHRPLSSMTAKEAYGIMRELQELEFPSSLREALTVALFKTAGIPTISKLLLATGQHSVKNAPKRSSDTDILLTEVQNTDPESTRHLQAIARMNYLHERYRKAGKILDDDMLHTLGSGLVEIFKAIDNHEWRKLTDVERCAIGVFHKNLGDAMAIKFTPLESSATGWENGLHFARELEHWTYQYEALVTKPTESCRNLANRFLDVGTFNLPKPFHPLVRNFVATRLDATMRCSMGIQPPGFAFSHLMSAIQILRKLVLRHLTLPRPSCLAVKILNDSPDPRTGLYNWKTYSAEPWYVKPTIWQQWGPQALFVRLAGSGVVPTMDSKYRPEGYDLRSIGPVPQEGKGIAEVDATVAYLRAQSRGGCPFHNFGEKNLV